VRRLVIKIRRHKSSLAHVSDMAVITAKLLAALGTVKLGYEVFSSLQRVGPRGYEKRIKHSSASLRGHRHSDNCTRDEFEVNKIPADIDYIVIGSGLSGLYAAALLSKVGKRVLVLEQHYIAGGCTHSFKSKNGYEFDTGVHYVGSINFFGKLLDLVTGERKIEWVKMGSEADSFCYDEVKLGKDAPLNFCAGRESFKKMLFEEFPNEKDSIEAYFDLVDRVSPLSKFYYYGKLFHPVIEWILNCTVNREYFKWANKTTDSVLAELTQNKRLRAVLTAQYGDYGLPPALSSFVIHAMLVNHYSDGAWYPVKGSQEISRAIIPTIEDAGGGVLTSVCVENIVIKNGKTVGVEVRASSTGGENISIDCKHGVISAVGIDGTNKLVKPEYRERLGFNTVLANVKTSAPFATIFIGLNGTAEELKLTGSNMWVHPVDENYEFTWKPITEDSWKDLKPDDFFLFIGFPSAKDPTFSNRFPGKSTCEIIMSCPMEWMSPFLTADLKEIVNPEDVGRQNDELYHIMKEQLQSQIMNKFYELFPQCKDRVEFIDMGTPLTNFRFYARPDPYGLEHSPARFGGELNNIRYKTNIENLFLTGQDMASCGLLGVTISAILTTHAVLGYGLIDLLLCKRNLPRDLLQIREHSKL